MRETRFERAQALSYRISHHCNSGLKFGTPKTSSWALSPAPIVPPFLIQERGLTKLGHPRINELKKGMVLKSLWYE